MSDNHDVEIIVVASIFQAIMTAAFVMRCISQRMRRLRISLDDVLLAIAFVAASLEIIVYAIATRVWGLGHHAETLRDGQLVWIAKIFFAGAFTNTTALAFAKLSLIVLLHRIFVVPRFRLVTWILAIIVILWWIANILAACLNCLPIESLWNPNVSGHCGDQLKIARAEPMPWILTDFAVLVAPLPLIKNLHLPTSQKWGIAALFLIGSVTCIVSCIRYSTVWFGPKDVTYDVHTTVCWTIVEASLGVIVVSLIVCRPALGRLVPKNIVQKFRSIITRFTPSFAFRGGSSRTLLFSLKRAPRDAPKISTFDDSDLKLAQRVHEGHNKEMGGEQTNTLSTRGEMENYVEQV